LVGIVIEPAVALLVMVVVMAVTVVEGVVEKNPAVGVPVDIRVTEVTELRPRLKDFLRRNQGPVVVVVVAVGVTFLVGVVAERVYLDRVLTETREDKKVETSEARVVGAVVVMMDSTTPRAGKMVASHQEGSREVAALVALATAASHEGRVAQSVSSLEKTEYSLTQTLTRRRLTEISKPSDTIRKYTSHFNLI
jgi:hypothetical protein